MDKIYLQKANKLLELSKQRLIEKNWNIVTNNNNIILESKEYPKTCSIPCYRVNSIINKTQEDLLKKIWFTNEKKMKKEDSDIVEWKILESGNNWRICRQVNQSTWPVWERETVFAQVLIYDNDNIWIVAFSVDHPKAPLQSDKYVRAIVHTSVYGIIKCNSQTSYIWKLSQVDPGGSINTSMVNIYSSKLVDIVENWKKN